MSFVKVILICNPLNGHYVCPPFFFPIEGRNRKNNIKGAITRENTILLLQTIFSNSPGPTLSENHSGKKIPLAHIIIHTLYCFFPMQGLKRKKTSFLRGHNL